MALKKIVEFFTDTVFHKEFGSSWLNWLARQYRLFFYTARGLQEHGTVVRCAALTFYTLVSIVPILAVVFAIMKGFGFIDKLIENLYALFPQNPDIIDYIVRFADKALMNTRGGVVAAVGVATLFWAVIRVFGSIENAFNNIWEVTSSRSITRRYSDYIAVVVVVPVLWIVANGVGSYAQELLGLEESSWLQAVSHIVSIVVMWVMFSFLYFVIPNTTVRFGSALTAGIIAGTSFMLFQWGYVWLQKFMTSYNAIYGSFAALPLFLIWVQISWEILLFGGELSFAYQNIDKFDEERESLHISYDSRRKVMIAAMIAVVRNFAEGNGAMSLSQVRQRLNLPTRIVNSVLYSLVDAGLLIELPAEGKGYETKFVPAKDTASFTVYGILEAVEHTGDTDMEMQSSDELRTADRVLEQLKRIVRESGSDPLLSEMKGGRHDK